MKAVRLVDFNDLRVEDLPDPEPGPHDVLVRIEAAGICGTDVDILRGNHLAYQAGLWRLPITPGHEWAGAVVQTGCEVTRFRPGDLVTGETGLGCLRCKYCLTGHHNLCMDLVETGIFGHDGAMRQLHVHPEVFTYSVEGLTAEQAALIEPASVAVHACKRVGLSVPDHVAVLGCGPIGLLAVQAARVFGARYVLATSRSAPKLALAEELGADRAVNVAEENLSAVVDEVTGGEGFEVVLECSGSIQALEQALDVASALGRVGVVGGYDDVALEHSVMRLVGKELTIVGSRGSPHAYAETISMVRKGEIDVDRVISHRFPLSRSLEAFELAERGGPDVLKILLLPQAE